jgi:hypothetical protein
VPVQVDSDPIGTNKERVAWTRQVGFQPHVGGDQIAAHKIRNDHVIGRRTAGADRWQSP